jgi:outer membrane protein assembly factor BamB
MQIRHFFLVMFLIISFTANSQEIYQWRGPARDGIFQEKNLLKNWPENGPKLLWVKENIGEGYGSIAVSKDMIFVNGKLDSLSVISALDLKGNTIWKYSNGKEFTGSDYTANFPGSRSTPTVVNDLVYVSSGNGRIACLEKQTGKEKWAIDMIKDFNGNKD